MSIKQLSTNGYAVSDVFSDNLLQELVELGTTFTPTSIRTGGDGTAIREVLFATGTIKTKVSNEVIEFLKQLDINAQVDAIELWRDHPGYTNFWHVDNPIIKNILIVYLDGTNAGTEYKENDQHYSVEYNKNTGLILLNSNQVLHGMVGKVEDSLRHVVYVAWSKHG